MNDPLRGRLLNWKFTQALAYLGDEPDDVRRLVEALARLVGDAGWFEGDLAIIIAAAIETIAPLSPRWKGTLHGSS